MFKLMGKKIFTILRWNILVYLDQWNLSVYTYWQVEYMGLNVQKTEKERRKKQHL